jgi:cell wall-associated NlpC family hydrolase
MVFGTNRSRLAAAMKNASDPDVPPRPTFQESRASLAKYTYSGGIDNPYGNGLAAYEPNTVLFDDYEEAWDAKELSEEEEALKKAQTITLAGGTTIGGPGTEPLQADGLVGKFINAAMTALGKPYVWGGTSLGTGVDCSGLIFAAMRAAGIDVPRYRAIDWGKQGAGVTQAQARAGDLVYWDNPNTTTDHVGIYLGGGKVLQAPQSGDVVKVSQLWGNPQFRRVFSDNQFQRVSTPAGHSYWGYGSTGRTWSNTPIASYAPAIYNTPTATGTVRRTVGGMHGLQEF